MNILSRTKGSLALIISFVCLSITPSAFVYAQVATPIISSISPTSAYEGDTITVNGSNFTSSSRVFFTDESGYPKGLPVVFLSASQVTFKIPLGITITHRNGSGNISVLNGDSWSTASNSFKIELLDTTPTITNIAPTTAHVEDTITLTGTGFNNDTRVYFADNYSGGLTGYWADPQSFTPTSLTFVIPFGVKGLRNLYVQHIHSLLKSNDVQLTVLPIAPILNALIPNTVRSGFDIGINSADTSVAAISHIDSDTRVMLDGITELPIGPCADAYATPLCFSVPSNVSVGTHSAYLKQKDSGLMSSTISFTVTDRPFITSLNGNFSPGGFVRFNGNGFDRNSEALIDGPAGIAIKEIATNFGDRFFRIAFLLPKSISKGEHTIQVRQNDTGKVSNSLPFSVLDGTSAPLPPLCTAQQTLVNNVCVASSLAPSPSALTTVSPAPAPISAGGVNELAARIAALRAQIKQTTVLEKSSTVSINSVSPGTGAPLPIDYPKGSGAPKACVTITRGLGLRSIDRKTDKDVSALQGFLAAGDYLKTTPTGYYGNMTVRAVKSFQKKYGIEQTGTVGPKTRAKIKEFMCQY